MESNHKMVKQHDVEHGDCNSAKKHLEWNQFSSSSHRKCSLPNACQKWLPEDKRTSDGRLTKAQSAKPENDHDYDDHFSDYGCDSARFWTVAMSPHNPLPTAYSVHASRTFLDSSSNSDSES